MSFRDFVTHLGHVLDQLGMSLHARTNFIKYVIDFYRVTLKRTLNELFIVAATISPHSLSIKTSPTG